MRPSFIFNVFLALRGALVNGSLTKIDEGMNIEEHKFQMGREA
jgi:hypothetical protein